MSAVLSLEDVERLGGTKEEYEELGQLESASEMEFSAHEEDEEDNMQRTEIKDYMLKIGLSAKSQTPATIGGGQTTDGKDRAGRKAKDEGLMEKSRREVKERTKKEKKKKKKVVEDGAEPRRVETAGTKIKNKISRSVAQERGEEKMSGAASEREKVEKQLLSLSVTPHTKLLVSPDSEQLWFDQSATTEAAYPVSSTVLAHLKSVAQQVAKTEAQLYEKFREKRKGVSDVKWLKNVLSSGTLSDKVAAHTMLVQESPVHSLASLDWLLGLVSKGGGAGSVMKGLHAKRKGILATNTLKELWVSELLPEHRKLKHMSQRPLTQLLSSSGASQRRSLLLWYFEDQIKSRYLQFITTLQAATHDPAEEVREKMLGHVFDLLYQQPEQEQLLLTQLVNKLGDPQRKVASKTVMFLLKLLNHHVNMKMVVTREIEALLHRPNISAKAQYYSVCCLNQLVLGPEDGPLVAKLIDVYFTFFKIYVKNDRLDSKLLAALLTGVNRAFPFMNEELPSFEDHLHSLFKVVHVGPISTGIQALMLLYQVMESRQSVSDRYYNALYSKLLDPALKHCNRQAMFLNVLFKSLKCDPSMNRVKAFVKRMLHISACHSPSFTCGCLVLLSELLKEKPILWPYVLQSNDEEQFGDDPTNQCANGPREDEDVAEQDRDLRSGADEREKTMAGHDCYRIGYRNPQFSRADNSCLWELSELTRHYHPSVQLFAKKIAAGETVPYTSDPLEDFTTIKFLDRFVYKNPKTKLSDHGGSAMQRISRSGLVPKKELMANSAAFAALDESKVDVKDLFMHRYLTQRGSTFVKQKRKRRDKSEVDEFESEDWVEEDEEGDGDQYKNEYASMDFAGELQRETRESREQKKKKKRKRDDDSSEEDEVSSENGDDADDNMYSYDGMDEETWGESEEEGERGDTVSEAELEKLLLKGMSDSGSEPEEEEEENDSAGKKKKQNKVKQVSLKRRFDPSKMFAAADEFSHILEGSSETGAHKEQLSWEKKKAVELKQMRQNGRMVRARGKRGAATGVHSGKRGRGDVKKQGMKQKNGRGVRGRGNGKWKKRART